MSSGWHDVSIPLRNGVTGWPGDPQFQMEPLARVARGNSCNTSLLTMVTHTGTHMDAPWHFVDSGKTLDRISPDVFFGPAYVLDLSNEPGILPEHIDRVTLPRLLIKTRGSSFDPYGPFRKDLVALNPQTARAVVKKGIKLVGIDYLSIGPYKAGAETHRILLEAEVLVIEGLRLAGLGEGTYPFVALPLPLEGADGSPCRAFVQLEQE